MAQPTAIKTLINLTQEQILNVERELARIANLKILEEKKIEELKQSTKEFSQKLNQKLSQGCSMKDYQSQNLLLNNFYLNIEQVQNNIIKLNEEHDILMKRWQEHYKKNMQFNTLSKRQESIDLLLDNKREQKNLDEHSLRAFFDKSKNTY